MSCQIVNSLFDPLVIEALRSGELVVLRTDTLYGILASANNEQAVEKVYQVKGRSEDKPPIVLISKLSQLFDQPTGNDRRLMDEVWPGPTSIIIKGTRSPWWLQRDTASVAYRLPDNLELQQLIEKVGPVIAPSANPEGFPPAATIQQAVEYFSDKISVFVDSGEVHSVQPSRLLRVNESGEVERLR